MIRYKSVRPGKGQVAESTWRYGCVYRTSAVGFLHQYACLLYTSLKQVERASDHVISPLKSLEDNLHGAVNFVILPIFAFANAGVISVSSITVPRSSS